MVLAATFSEFTEYVAVSAFLHTGDGWNYLSRAVAAVAAGDPDTARHLAYYSELRAAMGLLATQSMAVINSSSFVLTTSGSAIRVSDKETHRAAWELLDGWAANPLSTQLVADLVRPAARPLSDWLQAAGSGSQGSVVLRVLLGKWGLDLRAYSDDRDRRNQSSYDLARLHPSTLATNPAAAGHSPRGVQR
jgi:hypothetical protein